MSLGIVSDGCEGERVSSTNHSQLYSAPCRNLFRKAFINFLKTFDDPCFRVRCWERGSSLNPRHVLSCMPGPYTYHLMAALRDSYGGYHLHFSQMGKLQLRAQSSKWRGERQIQAVRAPSPVLCKRTAKCLCFFIFLPLRGFWRRKRCEGWFVSPGKVRGTLARGQNQE